MPARWRRRIPPEAGYAAVAAVGVVTSGLVLAGTLSPATLGFLVALVTGTFIAVIYSHYKLRVALADG